MQRIIMHMDLDSFYASVEEKRNPDLAGKPIVICVFSGRSADSGAVATANYKARELGIKAGIPITAAKRLASDETVFLPNDIEYYREVSERIMELIEEDCDSLEQASVDEAYMDVTNKSLGMWENAEKIAKDIKNNIKEHERLTCSIGIGPNKLIAKMASKLKKPDGLTVIKDEDVYKFLENLEIRKIHGIGGKTAEILNSLGIKTAKDLAHFNPLLLEERIGKNKTKLLQEKAQGADNTPVEQKEAQQIS
ncbi:MAG: DNA polymerase IV, partial [Candidatus Aenigmarchaeota archaeon]|nr:DNA polymerase IV [Candidatus Aenigmarchaeota archaeon]